MTLSLDCITILKIRMQDLLSIAFMHQHMDTPWEEQRTHSFTHCRIVQEPSAAEA